MKLSKKNHPFATEVNNFSFFFIFRLAFTTRTHRTTEGFTIKLGGVYYSSRVAKHRGHFDEFLPCTVERSTKKYFNTLVEIKHYILGFRATVDKYKFATRGEILFLKIKHAV